MKGKWINMKPWQACAFHVDSKTLDGRPCYLGLELSEDIAAVVLCFPPQSSRERYQFLFRFFIPKEIAIEQEKKYKIPYTYWIKKDLVVATLGDIPDYDFIEQNILCDSEEYEIREVIYDPWEGSKIIRNVEDKGLTTFQMRPTYYQLAGPTKLFEKMILARAIAHDGNPVMNWMITCTEIKTDRQGNKKPMKPPRKKTGNRIEGVIASIRALGRAARNEG